MSLIRARRAVVFSAILVLAGLPVIFPNASAEGWTKNDMGKPYDGNTYYGLYGVAVGDGDRDSSNEVYVTSFDDATVYQYTFTDAGWVSTDIASGGTYLYRVIVGDGDDDGTSEVYAAGYSYIWPNYGPMLQQVYQDDTGWHSNLITTLGYWTVNVAMGDGNNDNRTEIYTSDYYGHLYQNAKGKTWDSQDLGNTTNSSDSTYASMYGLAVGDGDNDGKNEVYGSSSIGYVDRFSYDGSSWKRNIVGRGEINSYYGENYSMIFAIKVGDADNDGRNEVYGVSWTNASVYRFAWDNSSKTWGRTTIATLGNWIYAYSLAIGDADQDGNNEIYAGTYKQVYKVWYDNSTKEWRSAGVGGGNSYMYDLAIGSATGDTSQVELYSACLDGHAYQFYTDKTPPANPKVTSDTHPVPGTWYNKSVVHVIWKDPGYDISGLDGYSVAWDKKPGTRPDDTKEFEEKVHEANSTVLADGNNWYFHIRSRDNAANWNATAAHFGPICIDTTPPDSLTASLDGGASYAHDRKVTVSLSATDPSPGSGVAWMSFSNDGVSWSPWESFSNTRYEWDVTEPRYGGNDSDGLKTVFVKVRDGAGNEINRQKWANSSIFLDRVSPYDLSILINGGDEYATSADVALSLDALDGASGVGEMAFSNDGVLWSAWSDWGNSTGWSLTQGAGGSDADGSRSVYFRVRDLAGNPGGPVRDTIVLDRYPPEALGITIDDGAEYATNATVRLDITALEPSPGSGLTDMAVANDAKYLDGWVPFAQRVGSWSLINGTGGTGTDGNKTVHLKARDRAGNVNAGGPVTDSIFLDRMAPDPVGLSINGGATYTTDPAVSLTLAADDPSPGSGLYAMQFSDDGTRWSDWTPYSSSLPYFLAGPDGTKTVYLRVRDHAGNIAPAVQATIILDTAPPVISNVRVLGITDTSALVSWSTNEDSDSAVEYGLTSAYGSLTQDLSFVTSHSVTLKSLRPSTNYHFRVRSADRAGNPPAFSSDYVFITAATPDTTPPMISDVRVQGITDKIAVVSWSTNEPGDSAVPFGKTATYGLKATDPAYLLKHSVVLSGLAPSTLYHFRVESKDSTGNGPAVSEDMTFTTLDAPDILPPVISNVRVTGITGWLAVVSWETSEPASGVVEYGNTTAYGSTVQSSAFSILHELTLTGLQPMTTYHFRVKSTDASGNGPSVSEDFGFSTSALPDTVPPALSKVRAEGITGTAATLLWETDEPSDSYAELGITTNYGLTAADGSFRLEHSLPVSGLKPDTLYHFRVRSTDPSGNPSTSVDLTFRTLKNITSPDKIPPMISDVEVTGISDTRAVVMWKTNELANGEIEYGTSMTYGLRASNPTYLTAHSQVLEGLRPSTEYHIRVKSVDVFGNGPSASADFSFKTAAGPDRTPPSVSSVRVLSVTSSGATISWSTDEPSNGLVEYGADTFYGRTQTSKLFVLNHTVELSGLSANTIYHFRVSSSDPAGNPSATGVDVTFTTLKASGGGGGTTPPPKPKPSPQLVNLDNSWPWIALALGAVCAAGAGYFVVSRRTRRESEAAASEAQASTEPPVPAVPQTSTPASPESAALAHPKTPASTTVPHEVPHVVQAAAPSKPAPVPAAVAANKDEVETVEMETGSSGAAAAALARSRPHATTPASTTPLKHIRCPSCKTRIPLYKEGPQIITCPGCGKKGPYKPKA